MQIRTAECYATLPQLMTARHSRGPITARNSSRPITAKPRHRRYYRKPPVGEKLYNALPAHFALSCCCDYCEAETLFDCVFILTTGLFYTISVGIMISFPSVLTPALVSSNSTDIRATSNQASWIAASNGFAGMCGFFILSPILQMLGRKVVHISCNLLNLIGWVIFPLANSIPVLFAARIIQGLAIGGIYIHAMIICEYVDPKRRGCFMTIKKVSTALGSLICHSMSLFWSWRQIAAFAIVLPTVAVILTFFWPESPSYLAMKGRFEDCEESFIWLKGRSNLNELHHLMSTQQERIKNRKSENNYKFLLKKEFLKPLVVVSLLTLLLDLCGKHYFVVYVIQIMVELIGDKSIAIYCSLAADCLIIFALVSSCFVIHRYKRRTFLFSSGIISVILMLLFSFLMLLKSYDIEISVWLSPSIIVLQSFVVNFGLVPVAFAIIAEIYPLEYKGFGSCISGVIFTFLYSMTIKLTPILMDSTGVGSTYGVYGLCTAVSLVFLYFVVPETKDKTLQQIEDEIKGVKAAKSEYETNTHPYVQSVLRILSLYAQLRSGIPCRSLCFLIATTLGSSSQE